MSVRAVSACVCVCDVHHIHNNVRVAWIKYIPCIRPPCIDIFHVSATSVPQINRELKLDSEKKKQWMPSTECDARFSNCCVKFIIRQQLFIWKYISATSRHTWNSWLHECHWICDSILNSNAVELVPSGAPYNKGTSTSVRAIMCGFASMPFWWQPKIVYAAMAVVHRSDSKISEMHLPRKYIN